MNDSKKVVNFSKVNEDFLLREFDSEKEFLDDYNELSVDPTKCQQFYQHILQKIKVAIETDDFEKFKHFSNLLGLIITSESNDKLMKTKPTNFYHNFESPFRGTNIVIVICKYYRLNFLKYVFDESFEVFKNFQSIGTNILKPNNKDENGHDAFYYATRSCNVGLLDTLVKGWPRSCFAPQPEELDKILSQAYEELRIYDVPLTGEIKTYVENKLIDIRLSLANFTKAPSNNVLLCFIEERIKLLVNNVASLHSLPNVNGEFIYIGKFIAQNIHTLKRKLRLTYDRLPWEEIEFCLISFISCSIKEQGINLFYNATLNRNKIVKYLNDFVTKLKMEQNNITFSNVKQFSSLPKLERDENMKNIIKNDPQFEELFIDYQKVRDMYSLEKMSKYIKISSTADPIKKEGQMVIVRSLQILGEHLKNTLESPKLSTFTSELLLTTLPTNTRTVVIDLRNSLSHATSLSRRIEIEQNPDFQFFTDIQNDIKKIGRTIDIILYNNKIKAAESILQQIADIKNRNDLEQIGCIFKNTKVAKLIFAKDVNYEITDHENLEDLIEEFKSCLTDSTDYEKNILKKLDRIIKSEKDKVKNVKHDFRYLMAVLADLYYKLKEESINDTDLRCIPGYARNHLNQRKSKVTSENLKEIIELITEVHLKYRIRKKNVHSLKMSRIIYDIIIIAEFEIDNTKSIDEFRQKLRKKMHINDKGQNQLHDLPKEIYKSQLSLKLSELENILKDNSLLKDSLAVISFKTDEKLVAVLEMLILDILSIVSVFDDRFENNLYFLDNSTPLLIGKYLRNHLAHDNLLTDVLLSDPLIALVLNAQKLATEKFVVNKNPTRKISNGDICNFNRKFDRGMKIVLNKEQLFAALESGNMKLFEESIRKGADVNSRNDQLWTTLHFAAKGGNLEIVKRLLDQKVDLNLKNIDHQTPLHIAAQFGRASIVEYFIAKKCYGIDDKDCLKKAPLHYAAEKGHTNIVEILLKHKADTTTRDNYGYAPLHYATMNNHVETIKLLLEREKTVDGNLMFGGFTPLYIAASTGHLNLVNIFLERGANIHMKSDRDVNILRTAVFHGHIDVVRTLISKGVDVNSSDVDGSTPLSDAALYGFREIAQILLDHGADPNINGKTITNLPVYCAARGGFAEIVKLLLEHKAEPNVKTSEGVSPLSVAVHSGHLETVTILADYHINDEVARKVAVLYLAIEYARTRVFKFLLNHRMSSDIGGYDFSLLLHRAAHKGQKDIVDLLIRKVRNVNRPTGGSTALHAAAENGNKDIIITLLDNGADVNVEEDDGMTPILLAAKSGNIDAVEIFIGHGCNVNIDSAGLRPIHVAASNGHKDVVDLLIKNGADCNARGRLGATALHEACASGCEDIIELLIENRADISIRDDFDSTPFGLAIVFGEKHVAEMLIASGADVNEDGGRPLYYAVKSGKKDVIELLLKNGACARANYCEDEPLLCLAVKHADEEIVRALLSGGVDVNCRTPIGETPLHIAVALSQGKIVQLLLDSGANINSATSNGMTVLHYAARLSNNKILETLLRRNADINKRTNDNATALQLAVAYDRIKNAKTIFRHAKVDVNQRLDKQWTLLHYAALAGSLEMVKFLVDEGADVKAKTKEKLMPVQVAAKKNNTVIVKFFIEQGSGIHGVDSSHRTLLHYAASSNNIELAEYLIRRGVDVNSRDSNDSTPLHAAALGKNVGIIEILLKNGAFHDAADKHKRKPRDLANEKDVYILRLSEKLFEAVKRNSNPEVENCIKEKVIVDVKSAEDMAPLHYAAWKGYSAIVNTLLKSNCNPNVCGKNRLTALHYAAKFSHSEIVKMLLAKGAMYNCISKNNETPADMAVDKNIKYIFKFINESFEKVKDNNTRIISDLRRVKDVDLVKAVIGTVSSENESLNTVAVKSNFRRVDELKDIFQDNQATMMELAQLLLVQEKYEEALAIYQNLYESRCDILGPNNLATLEVQALMSLTLYNQLKLEEALEIIQEVSEKRQQILGENHKSTLSTKSALAMMLYQHMKLEEAREIIESVHREQKKILKPHDQDLITTQTHMAMILDASGKHDEAIELSRHMYEKLKEEEGELSIQTITTQNNLALFLINKGENEEALAILKKVHEHSKRVSGPHHSNTLKALKNIALVYKRQKRENEALEAYQEFLKLQEKILNPGHLDILNTKQNIADIYMFQGKFCQAHKILNECLRQREAIQGSNHPEVSRIKFEIEAISNNMKSLGVDLDVLHSQNSAESLSLAVREGNVETVKYLLENNADINNKYEDGRTLLHFAADTGNAKIASMLLEKGAIVTNVTKKGNTPLHIAVLKNSKEVVHVLLRHAKRSQLNNFVNAKTLGSGSTALHVATKSGYFEIVVSLLKYNAIYEIKDKAGSLPQFMAKNSKIIKLLKSIDQLFKGVKNGNDAIFEELKLASDVNLEAILNARNCDNKSIVQIALLNKRKVMANKLLSMLKKFDR